MKYTPRYQMRWVCFCRLCGIPLDTKGIGYKYIAFINRLISAYGKSLGYSRAGEVRIVNQDDFTRFIVKFCMNTRLAMELGYEDKFVDEVHETIMMNAERKEAE